MRNITTAFYRGKTGVHVDFSAGGISPDGAVVLLEKLERKHKPISYFNKHMTDRRHPLRMIQGMEELLKRRVSMLMQDYEDTNDVAHLLTLKTINPT